MNFGVSKLFLVDAIALVIFNRLDDDVALRMRYDRVLHSPFPVATN